MNDSMIPRTTNTMISSSIVKPATRYRCVVEGLSTDASPKCRPATGCPSRAKRMPVGLPHATGPFTFCTAFNLQCIELYTTRCRAITYRYYMTYSCHIRPNRQNHRNPQMAGFGTPTHGPRYAMRPPPPARYGAGQSMRKVPRHLEQPASTTGCTNGSRWVQWGHTPYDWPHAAAAPATSLGRSTIVQRSGRTLTNSRYSQRTVTGWWSTSRITWPPVARITRYHAPR